VVLCEREGIREGYPSAEAVRRSNATEAKKRGSGTVILYASSVFASIQAERRGPPRSIPNAQAPEEE